MQFLALDRYSVLTNGMAVPLHTAVQHKLWLLLAGHTDQDLGSSFSKTSGALRTPL